MSQPNQNGSQREVFQEAIPKLRSMKNEVSDTLLNDMFILMVNSIMKLDDFSLGTFYKRVWQIGLFSDNSNAALIQCRISCKDDKHHFDIPVSIIYPIDEVSTYQMRVFLKLSQSMLQLFLVELLYRCEGEFKL